MKATIVRDGIALELETSNATEMKEALANFFPSNQSVKNVSPVADTRVGKHKNPIIGRSWSQKSLGIVARIISENASMKTGVSTIVFKELQKLGDTRSQVASQVITNRVKRYLMLGDKGHLSSYMTKYLKAEGFGAKSVSSTAAKKEGNKKRYSGYDRWTTNDILGVANIVSVRLLSGDKFSGECINFIRKYGDNKSRSEKSIYTTASDIKLFMTGANTLRIPNKIRNTLTSNGYPKKQLLPSVSSVAVPQEA